jgi:flagellar biosynthesis protein FlhG
MKYLGAVSSFKNTRTIAITSGKGGVGKTTMTANIALQLSREGQKVLVFDGDLGLANVDIFLGVKPKGHLGEVVRGEKTMSEILTEVSPNLFLISGGSGIQDLNKINAFERRELLDSVSELPITFDYMIIDTASGISENVLFLNSAAQQISVVLTPDPSSFADSYALIKLLHKEYKENKFRIICNQVRDESEGVLLFNRFSDVVNRFMDVSLDYWGAVPQDVVLRRATQLQRLILRHDPQAISSKAILDVTQKIQSSVSQDVNKSGLQFFWEQVVGVA